MTGEASKEIAAVRWAAVAVEDFVEAGMTVDEALTSQELEETVSKKDTLGPSDRP